ncbi:MAG: UPF0175 family protein [Limnospira sp. PMC 1291.21]|uniref:UPF0175 family protein n=1 Tax=Limnospira TaxID=2596745 RepID=UPI0001E2A16E|nr:MULTISPECIES: UPF0175 family protein [Limnospira]MDY7051650.1 UPF0175 family protein [Limnospira fusiformis LS22]MDT9180302.1 UPF0175 family protein [Limnospira sp. PMC 1238.20]MDT9195612.1 UPF0175 family protein [Limnospira sp. PMC 1245.20]MDT9205920.1 UPF0175 family protein [Limnospira sp. PMC 1243.20]MDT9211045.1 UPF0175 family protein [Limnospira sp. PMC 1252.20]
MPPHCRSLSIAARQIRTPILPVKFRGSAGQYTPYFSGNNPLHSTKHPPEHPMQITIEIPDEYIQQLQPNLDNFSQRILETLVIDAYEAQQITAAEVGHILNLDRFAVEHLLKQKGAYYPYSLADFEQDLQTLNTLQNQ